VHPTHSNGVLSQKQYVKHQKAISISVISKIAKQDRTNFKQTKAQLATIGIFFAMRSCEYLKVQASKQCRTKIVRLRNIRFFTGTKQLEHNCPQLEFADCIAITFKQQKKDKKMDTITLMALVTQSFAQSGQQQQ
jgi:hypothetical protein